MARPASDRIKVNVYLPPRLLQALKKIAQIRGTSYSELVREACQEYAIREGKRVIEDNRALGDVVGDDAA